MSRLARSRAPRGRALYFLCALALAGLPACKRSTTDPKQRIRELTGGEPLNRISAYGRARMPANEVLGMPQCDVVLNERTSVRMLLDSGAGDFLAVNPTIADESGLGEPLVTTVVGGFGGSAEGRVGILDELVIGEIRCERVLTFVSDGKAPLLQVCDGVVGTGIFANARVRLDFERAQLTVSPSCDQPAPGAPVAVDLSKNAHVLATVELAGAPATAMLDTGAGATFFSTRWLDKHLRDRPYVHLPLPKVGVGERVGAIGNVTSAELLFAGRRIGQLSGAETPELDDTMREFLGQPVDMVIGMTLFRQMRSWTVDFARRKMWVDWLAEEP